MNNLKAKIDQVVRTVPDFPKKGISFKDITPLLLDCNLTDEIIDSFVEELNGLDVDAVVGVESRGFLFGFLLANKLRVPFVPVRKVGKLPGETLRYKYNLEYGSSEVEIHKEDINEGWNVLIHDDLLATGGTAVASAELISQLNANVTAFAFVIELGFLNGKDRLKEYSDNIISLTNY